MKRASATSAPFGLCPPPTQHLSAVAGGGAIAQMPPPPALRLRLIGLSRPLPIRRDGRLGRSQGEGDSVARQVRASEMMLVVGGIGWAP